MTVTAAPGLTDRSDLWNPRVPVAWVDDHGEMQAFDGTELGPGAAHLLGSFDKGEVRRLPPELWTASAGRILEHCSDEVTLDRLSSAQQTLLRLVFSRLIVAHALFARGAVATLTPVPDNPWRLAVREPDLSWWLLDALRAPAPPAVEIAVDGQGGISTETVDLSIGPSWPEIHPADLLDQPSLAHLVSLTEADEWSTASYWYAPTGEPPALRVRIPIRWFTTVFLTGRAVANDQILIREHNNHHEVFGWRTGIQAAQSQIVRTSSGRNRGEEQLGLSESIHLADIARGAVESGDYSSASVALHALQESKRTTEGLRWLPAPGLERLEQVLDEFANELEQRLGKVAARQIVTTLVELQWVQSCSWRTNLVAPAVMRSLSVAGGPGQPDAIVIWLTCAGERKPVLRFNSEVRVRSLLTDSALEAAEKDLQNLGFGGVCPSWADQMMILQSSQLKNLCKERSLSSSGSKADLVHRLAAAGDIPHLLEKHLVAGSLPIWEFAPLPDEEVAAEFEWVHRRWTEMISSDTP